VALGAPHRPVAFAVPTGNFGDAFAGWVAAKMGLPIERIIVATNQNDIMARALSSGQYVRGVAKATLSPAMDIQVASNFERLYFESTGRNALETDRAFRAFNTVGALDLPPGAISEMRQLFEGIAVSEEDTNRQILASFRETGQLIDPHTAVGMAAARRCSLASAAVPIAVLATAHAAKFPEAVEAATGVAPSAPAGAQALVGRPESFDVLAADLDAVKAYVRAFKNSSAR